MDCKHFTAQHAAFIDDTLPGIQMAVMREHLTTCLKCARRDTEVRRALLLLRNMPAITVSDGFERRLQARIAAEPAIAASGRYASGWTTASWALAATLVTAVGGVAWWAGGNSDKVAALRLPAVVASTPPALVGSDESAPAFLASMSTGIPMWPALMLAEEGPLRFANAEQGWDAARQHD
jgi:hypothetical protein